MISRIVLVIWLFSACSPSIVRDISNSEVFKQNHTGFYLYDAEKDKVLADYNGEKYFTPASNTKIFTFYTSLRLLGDSVPALHYVELEDSLIFWGTGDPSFLHPDLPGSQVSNFLKSSGKELYYSDANFMDDPFGAGWAWDDYYYYYQPEKSSLPVHGNFVRIIGKKDSAFFIQPGAFSKMLSPKYEREETRFERNFHSNEIYFSMDADQKVEKDLPYRVTNDILVEIMEDTLGVDVTYINRRLPEKVKTLYSIPSDSLYKRMMMESDNFIAEQLMLMNAGIISDSLKTSISIEFSKDSLLADLPDPIIWRDGSGLSRYNLFTPRSIVKLWVKIQEMMPRERLYQLIPAGGVTGTLENWYASEKPYIHGKTGTLSNNHCLSGYIETKSGKTLVFSFMNNNYRYGSSTIKVEMERILREVYEKY